MFISLLIFLVLFSFVVVLQINSDLLFYRTLESEDGILVDFVVTVPYYFTFDIFELSGIADKRILRFRRAYHCFMVVSLELRRFDLL